MIHATRVIWGIYVRCNTCNKTSSKSVLTLEVQSPDGESPVYDAFVHQPSPTVLDGQMMLGR